MLDPGISLTFFTNAERAFSTFLSHLAGNNAWISVKVTGAFVFGGRYH